jgi:ATP-dependent helicase/nuclease subunit A
MTVHGAKGLEAPLVILADTATIPDGRNTRLHDLPNSAAFVWAGSKKLDSPPEQAARAAADELREAEYRRLLYVALTRAADALVVCGHEGKDKLKEGCWYRLVRDALEADSAGLVETEVPYSAEKVLRWRPEPMGRIETPRAEAAEPVALQSWLMRDAPPPPAAPLRIAPSQFDPDDAPASPYAPAALGAPDPRRRGDLVHRLLQFLPQAPAADRAAAAARLLAATAPELPADVREALAREAIRVIEHPELAELFGPQSLAEVDVIARAAEPPYEIFGRIDRLAVGDDAVTIADFKTGAPPARAEDAPVNYVQQLAAYSDAVARVYPGKAMRALLVWTAGPAIHRIGTERLEAARLKLLQTASAGRSP